MLTAKSPDLHECLVQPSCHRHTVFLMRPQTVTLALNTETFMRAPVRSQKPLCPPPTPGSHSHHFPPLDPWATSSPVCPEPSAPAPVTDGKLPGHKVPMCCFLLSPGTMHGRDGYRLTGGPNALHPNCPVGQLWLAPRPHECMPWTGLKRVWAVPRLLPHLPEERLTERSTIAREGPELGAHVTRGPEEWGLGRRRWLQGALASALFEGCASLPCPW